MAAPILLEAQRLADLGLAVHWLWGPEQQQTDLRLRKKSGKRPVGKWKNRPALTAQQLEKRYRVGFNLALITGLVPGAERPLVAIDIDAEPGFSWCARRGIPVSPVRTLTRHGQHWIYRHPGRGLLVGNRVKVDSARCVDVRGERGNVTLAPSVHHSGFVYQPVELWTRRLLDACPVFDPGWIPQPPAALDRFAARTHQDLDSARRALARMWPAVQGQNGSRACYIAACTLIRRYKLDEQSALALLLSDYNPRCVPPWSERELQHKVRDAAKRYAGHQGANPIKLAADLRLDGAA